jgi:IQ domain-containing protein H
VRTPTTRLPRLSNKSATFPNGTIRSAARTTTPPHGLINLLETGMMKPDTDLEPLLTTDGPMQSTRVVLHKAKERSRRPPLVMTENSGFSGVRDYKYDMAALAQIPAALNLEELKGWEAAQAQEKRAQEQAAAAAAASEKGVRTPSPPPQLPTASFSAAVDGTLLPTDAKRDDTRTYTQLLDLYSMHEFIIRKGKTLRNTPEFASFKRHYSASWGEVEGLIEALEELLSTYGVELAYVDGKRLAQLASYQAPDLVTPGELVQCIANAEEVWPLVSDASRPFHYAPRRHHVAATKIQATWHMYRQRIAYVHLLIGTRAAIAIQRQWATYRAHCMTRRTIRSLRETNLLRWRQTMEEFKAAWPQIEEGRRTVIHIPSLSYPTYQAKNVPFYEAQQLGQLTRLSMLADPRVQMVFVVPEKPEAEVQQYYLRLLTEGGVSNVAGRLTYVVPENAARLPSRLSLTRMVLLSPRLLKLLAALCTGKPTYIVPAVVGAEELTLASQLNVPLLSAEPRIVQAHGSKSGCRRLFEAADVLTPPGAAQLRSRADLLHALTSLILGHREVSRWLIKLENEFSSHGHAYLDVSRLRALQESDDHTSDAALEGAVTRELETHGAKRVRLLHPHSYPSWEAYLAMFDMVGGTVEAVLPGATTPVTAHLFIAPSGTVRVESVVEPLLAPALTVMGSLFPCRSHVPYAAIRGASLSLGKAAYRKRVIGHLSVDFIVTTASDAAREAGESSAGVIPPPQQRVWGVDVDFGLTTYAAAHSLAAVATGSTWDVKRGTCVNAATGVSLAYAYSGILYSPYISTIRHADFVLLCQSRGLAFDCSRRSGVVFHFLNSFVCNCVGAIAIAPDEALAVRRLADFQLLLNMKLPKQGEHLAESNCVYFSSLVRQLSQLTRQGTI